MFLVQTGCSIACLLQKYNNFGYNYETDRILFWKAIMCDAKLFRNTKINAARFSPGCIYVVAKQLLLLSVVFVRNCQLCTSLCATSCQYAAAILCSHSLTETVLVLSLSVRGLECSFHRLIFLYVLVKKVFYAIQRAKLLLFFRMAKILQGNFAPKQKRKQHVAFFFCDSEAIRTLDPRLRRALLYPAELRNRPLL